MSDCIFCAIAAGDVPSARVYEDERIVAFLDIHPLRPGHTLVVPRQHAPRLSDCEPETAAALMRATRRVTAAIHDAMDTQDATIAINDGPSAGQEVPHVHVHVVPRQQGDGGGPVHALFPDRPPQAQADIQGLAASVRSRLEAAA